MMSMLRAGSSCVFAIAVVMTTAAAGQQQPDFTGRWRLVTSPPPADAAISLLFRGPTPGQGFFIERRLETGVVSEVYTTDPRRRSMGFEARWIGDALVLINPGYDSRGAAPSAPGRDEKWSIGSDGALHVDVTMRLKGAAATTSHLVYARVPLPVGRPGENLLDNPDADSSGRDWLALGDAKVEACDGNPCFVVRNQGSFQQTVLLPSDAAGTYVVMLGSGWSERIERTHITGQAYLYGMLSIPDGSRYVGYLQGMRAMRATPNTWVSLFGIFPVPDGAARLSFQLKQAAGRGAPQNGSAARFDDLGCYLFPTDADARVFIEGWRGRQR